MTKTRSVAAAAAGHAEAGTADITSPLAAHCRAELLLAMSQAEIQQAAVYLTAMWPASQSAPSA